MSRIRIVGLGEALLDCFANHQVIGGAPLNFAYHAHQLINAFSTGNGILASRIGQDDSGDRIQNQLAGMSMNTQYLQRDSDHATGDVIITFDGNEVDYTIRPDVAWDHLRLNEAWKSLATNCHAVCFGTLAQRQKTSRETIRHFLRLAPSAIKICDVNLRQTFYDADLIRHSLRVADVAKLNSEEVVIVGNLLNLCTKALPIMEQAATIRDHFHLRMLVLTRGDEGTVLFTQGASYTADVPQLRRHHDADSVGAGDACCAAVACGLVLQWSPHKIVALANHVGAFVASQPGATPELPPFC